MTSPILSHRGSAVVELALVLPFILLVFLATIEISRLLRAAQTAHALSREAGNAIYRECSDFLEPEGEDSPETKARTQQCVQDVWNNQLSVVFQQLAPSGDNSLQVVLSIYRYVAVPGGGMNYVQRFALVNDGPAPRNTHYFTDGYSLRMTTVSSPTVFSTKVVFAHQRLAIAEVYYPVNPIIRIIPILGTYLYQGDYYAVAVL